MEFYYIFIIISVLTSANSKAFTIVYPDITKEVPQSLARVKRDMDDTHTKVDHCTNCISLPIYSICLMGLAMFFMLIVIVVLAVALHLARKNKSIFGFNASNKEYVRHESTGVTPLYNANYDEQNKNNGSTLTVNSGIIEISEPRASDPTTPTRLEDSKIVFSKRPLRPIVPLLNKGQMDALCKEVLRKVQKSDSASFRDLNELLKFEKRDDNFGMKSEDVKESEKEKNEENAEFNVESRLFKLKKPEIKTETKKEIKTEAENETKPENKDETKQETKNETTNTTESETKPDESKDAGVEVDKVESDKNEDDSDSETEYDTVPSPIRFRHSGPEPDQTIYDTVPNPISYRHSGPESDQTMYDTVPNAMKFRHSGPESDHLDQSVYDMVASPKKNMHSGADTDDDIDDIPLYDLPPTRRSQDGPPRNVIQMDPESHYLMPISSEKTDSCYVNAKRQSFKSP